jgi:serine phosphatase RsbU (regulator of sigma subunit)
MMRTGRGASTIELQQKLARVQSLLEAARKVHATLRIEEVERCVLELAAKELEAKEAFLCHDDELPTGAGYFSAPVRGERVNTISQLVVRRPDPLSLEEQDFLEGLALQSAVAINNARHHERMLEWERVQLDLAAARSVQRSLLPQSVPAIPGYGLSIRSTPCYEVGGDYVDALPLPDGRWMLAVADVAGKGLASALVGMSFRSSVRAIAGAKLPLPEVAARLNQLHWDEGEEARQRYVTAMLLRFDPRCHSIEAVNAGHTPAFIGGSGQDSRIDASGPPLGLLRDSTYEAETFFMEKGSQLLLYTDGLTEVFRDGEEFGEDRLRALLGPHPGENLLDRVWATLSAFAGNDRQTDDMTALYLWRASEG